MKAPNVKVTGNAGAQEIAMTTNSNAGSGTVDRRVGRPLTYRQKDVLAKAPSEWGKLLPGVGCTNATLEALEKRGLVETRYCAEGGFVHEGRQHLGWQWRKTPNA